MSERFLRGGIFDELLTDVQTIYDGLEVDDSMDEFYLYYIDSLLRRFKDNKVLLLIIEKSIEEARQKKYPPEISGPLTEAIMHIQSEIKTLHELLMFSTNNGNPFDFSNLE